MVDRPQPETLRPVEGSARVQRQLHSASLGNGVDHVIPAPDLSPTDHHTWEMFWSSLFDEYESIYQEMAEAA